MRLPFVKLRPGTTVSEDDLRHFLSDKLSPIERPKHIEFRDELPKTMIGKLSRKELVAEETAESGEGPAAEPDAGKRDVA